MELMEESVEMRYFSINIENENNNEKRVIKVQQIHIICWSDHTIPKAEDGRAHV